MTYLKQCFLVLIASWCGVGCSGCLSMDFGDGFDGFGCLFNFDFEPTIASDEDKLRAIVRCEPDADCADQREVLKGASFRYIIEIPVGLAQNEQSVTSTGEARAALSGYDTAVDACDDVVQLDGEVRYPDVGTATVAVYGDDAYIDSFTVTVHEASTLDVQAGPAQEVLFGGPAVEYVSYTPADTISIDNVYALRAFVRNEQGDRLIGADDFEWSVADPSIVRAGEGQRTVLTPYAIGTTTLTLRAAGLSVEIPIAVTGLRNWEGWEDTDGGEPTQSEDLDAGFESP